MFRMFGAVIAAATISFAGSASAAVIQTWTLAADEPYFELFNFSLGDLKGKHTVTVHSSRPILNQSAATSEYVDWHLHPVSGTLPGLGERWYADNQLAYHHGDHFVSVDFDSIGYEEYEGCCLPDNGEWVRFDEHFYRDSILWASFDFQSGNKPIIITLSLSAIPEPATWAMMIIGFGGAGAMLRRSRKNGAQLVNHCSSPATL